MKRASSVSDIMEIEYNLSNFDEAWKYNDPVGTRAIFTKIKSDFKDAENKNGLWQLQTQIARTHSLKFEFDEAHKILDDIQKHLSEASNLTVIRYYLERGRSYNSDKKLKEAEELFHNAWKLGKSEGMHFFAVDAAHMIAIVEKDPNNQISWNMEAIDYAENSHDEKARGWLGSLYNNTGWSYFDKNDYEKALELFERNYNFRKSKNQKQNMRIAKWCMAKVQRVLNNIEKALEMQLEIKNDYESDGLDVGGYTYEELGELFLIKNEPEKYKENFKNAFERLSTDKWLQNNEMERLKRMKKLAGI